MVTDTPVQSPSEPSPLKDSDAARFLGFSPELLQKWRRLGRGPAFIRIGRSVRYRVADLEDFLRRHRVETRA